MGERLCVVMPVYNEEGIVGTVLSQWAAMLQSLGIDFAIYAYNDGSTDNSLAILQKSAETLGERVHVKNKANSGHGDTVLAGYREAAADGFEWVFQIDSDNEIGTEGFEELWSGRHQYDFLVGRRAGRSQAWARKVVSFVSRLSVRILYGSSVWDVNSPYRLMRVDSFRRFFDMIPAMTFAPNVMLSGLAAYSGMKCLELPVHCQMRRTGEENLKKWKLFRSAVISWWQTVKFRIRLTRIEMG